MFEGVINVGKEGEKVGGKFLVSEVDTIHREVMDGRVPELGNQ